MARPNTAPQSVVTFIAVLAVLLIGTGSLAAAQTPDPPLCFDQEATIVGTDGDDVLLGTPGDDVIIAGAGNDVIRARGGNDFVCGGDGDDTIYGASGADHLDGEAGDDKIFGRSGRDQIYGGPGRDVINGGAGNDWATGGDGDDTVLGRGGNDRLAGVDGQDRMRGGPGDDLVVGGVGADSTLGGPGEDACEISPEEPSSACESVTTVTYHSSSVALSFSGQHNPEGLLGPEAFAYGQVDVYSAAFPDIPVWTRSAVTTSIEVVFPDTSGEIRYLSAMPGELSGLTGQERFEANEPGPLDVELSVYALVPN